MLQIFNEYNPNANPPNTDYPNGSGKDESVSGANDGTPLEMGWYNDMLGFSEALLGEGRLTPSGDADTALVSDRLDGFRLAALRVQTACDFTNGDLTLVDVIHVGLDVTTVEYVIDRNSLTRWSTSGTTGTVTADDLDTVTGALSGVSGMLTQVNPLNSDNNLSDVADESTAFDNIKQAATETETGVQREATQAEVDARSGDGFVTSSKLPKSTVREVILQKGLYTSGIFSYPNSRTEDDYEEIMLIGGSSTGTEIRNSSVLTQEHIDAGWNRLTSYSFSSSRSSIDRVSSTEFSVSVLGSEAVFQVVGRLK